MRAAIFIAAMSDAMRDDKSCTGVAEVISAGGTQMRVYEEHIAWTAQTVHQAYHQDIDEPWERCPRDVCASTMHVMRNRS